MKTKVDEVCNQCEYRSWHITAACVCVQCLCVCGYVVVDLRSKCTMHQICKVITAGNLVNGVLVCCWAETTTQSRATRLSERVRFRAEASESDPSETRLHLPITCGECYDSCTSHRQPGVGGNIILLQRRRDESMCSPAHWPEGCVQGASMLRCSCERCSGSN